MSDDPGRRDVLGDFDEPGSASSASEVPVAPPKLLAGRSAIGWARVMVAGGLLAIVAVLPAPFISAIADQGARDFWLGVSFGSGILLAGLATVVATWNYVRRRGDELRAGYTTLRRGFELYWQLDPKTGAVVRPPTRGAPLPHDIRER